MTTTIETIRRITVEGKTIGVNEAAASLTALARAQTSVQTTADGMTTTTERSSRQQLSVARSYDAVRARVDDVFRAQREQSRMQGIVDRALRQGSIDQAEYAKTSALVAERFRQNSTAVNDNVKQLGLARHEMVNLSRQGQDVVTMLAMGASPMQVITSQAAQIYDIFASSQGTIKGFFGQVTSGIASVVTPARVLVGVGASIVGAAVLAGNSWQSAEKEIRVAVSGIGRASGATVGDIRRIAEETSFLGGLSARETEKMATTFAATGRIGKEQFAPLIGVTKDLAATIGVDLEEATGVLAQSLGGDLVKGFDALNDRLGFGSGRMREQIVQMQAMGDRAGATRVIIDGMKTSLISASDSTSYWGKMLNVAGNVGSMAWRELGKGASEAFGLTKRSIEDELAALNRRKQAIEQTRPFFSATGIDQSKGLDEVNGKIATMEQKLRAAAEQALRVASNMRALDFAPTVLSNLPEEAERRSRETRLAGMRSLQNNQTALAESGLSAAQVARSIEIEERLARSIKSQGQNAIEAAELRLRAAGAVSPSQREAIARQEMALQLERQGITGAEARRQIDLAGATVRREMAVQMSEAARDRQLHAEQLLAQANQELQLVGRGIAAQTELRMNLQTRQQLEQEAARQRTAVDEAEYQRLIKINAEIAKKAQARALADATSNTQFQSDTLFMSSSEQGIASSMRGIYGDSGWQSQMTSALAIQMRLNNSMREFGETGRASFVSVGQAMRDGKVTAQEWSSITDNLSSRLMDLAMNSAWDRLIGGGRSSGGGIMGFLGSMFGAGNGGVSVGTDGIGGFGPTAPSFDRGGYTGPGSRSTPAGVVHAGEYVFDARATSRAGVANLEALHSSLRGYANGGYVAPVWSPPAANSNHLGAGRGELVQIELMVSVNDDGTLGVIARQAGSEGGKEAANVRIQVFSENELPRRMSQIQANPRRRGAAA